MNDQTFIQKGGVIVQRRALFNLDLNKQSPLETLTLGFVQRMFIQNGIIRRKYLKTLLCSLFKRLPPTGGFVFEQSPYPMGAGWGGGFAVYLPDPKKEATT